jgi:hypothetical protein
LRLFRSKLKVIAASLIAVTAVVSAGLGSSRHVGAADTQCIPPVPCVSASVEPQFVRYELFHQVWTGAVGNGLDNSTPATGKNVRLKVPATTSATSTGGNVCDPADVGPCGSTSGPDACAYYTCQSQTMSWWFFAKDWTGNMGTGTYNGGWFVATPSTPADCDGNGTCYLHMAHGNFNQVQSANGDYGICGVSMGTEVHYQVDSYGGGQQGVGNYDPINFMPNGPIYNNSGSSTTTTFSANTPQNVGVSDGYTQAGGTVTDGGYNANAQEYDAHARWTDTRNGCQDTPISVRSVSDWVFNVPSDYEDWNFWFTFHAEYTYQD